MPKSVAVTGVGSGWTTPSYSRWLSLDYAYCNTVISGVPVCGNRWYEYTTTFTLPVGTDLSSASLVTQMTYDDDVAFYLNGALVLSPSASSAWKYFQFFSVGPANANFVVGTNTLTFRITNSGGGITGLDISRISVLAGSCSSDAECGSDRFCDTQNARCTPKLVNGTNVPTLSGHSPALTGSCSTAAGAAVCLSGLCSTGTNKCVACASDAAGSTAPSCQAAQPICFDYTSTVRSQRPQNTCGCTADSDCASTDYCSSGLCVPKLANGTAMPQQAGHTPALDGVCSTYNSTAAAAVCASGVCDTASNQCGLDLTSATCSSDAQCTSGVCVSSGPNAGHCEACKADAQCGGATAVCDTTSNVCVQCTGGDATACTATTPLCDTAAGSCVACDGNDGSLATHACPMSAQYCADDGSCSTQCQRDGDCGAGNWCNAGACTPKLANGVAMPTVAGHTPALTGACASYNAAAAAAVCASDVCDTASHTCGIGLTAGTCSADSQCTSGVCVSSGPNAGKCESCVSDAQCGGPSPACDPTSNTCEQCTASSAALCIGTVPICDLGSDTCVACNGNAGSLATHPCAGGAPYCADDGACSAQCQRDGDCGAGNWCDAGTCTPQLANGVAMPSSLAHAPALDGTCTAPAGVAVCASGVCDATSNTCGIDLGRGTCAADAQCTTGVCVTSGANVGLCEACISDAQCSGATPACDTTDNTCVVCLVGNAGQCTSETPVCDGAVRACVACNGDHGSPASAACPSANAPYCGQDGSCGKCIDLASCATGVHAGPACNAISGACGDTCTVDADCGALWCDNPTAAASAGVCRDKLDNGQPLPASAPINATCSPAVAARVCVSGTCDAADALCGLANGRTCSDAAECRSDVCNTNDLQCGDPNDSACSDATTCRSGICDPDGKCGALNGQACTTPAACRSAVCVAEDNTCGALNGAPCEADSECRSGVCYSDGHCGKPVGQACAATDVCRGVPCVSGTCSLRVHQRCRVRRGPVLQRRLVCSHARQRHAVRARHAVQLERVQRRWPLRRSRRHRVHHRTHLSQRRVCVGRLRYRVRAGQRLQRRQLLRRRRVRADAGQRHAVRAGHAVQLRAV